MISALSIALLDRLTENVSTFSVYLSTFTFDRRHHMENFWSVAFQLPRVYLVTTVLSLIIVRRHADFLRLFSPQFSHCLRSIACLQLSSNRHDHYREKKKSIRVEVHVSVHRIREDDEFLPLYLTMVIIVLIVSKLIFFPFAVSSVLFLSLSLLIHFPYWTQMRIGPIWIT